MNEFGELISKPGDTIVETMDELGMTYLEVSGKMDKTLQELDDIISGKDPITPETAGILEKVFGIDTQFWINREALYREKLLGIDNSNID